MASHPSRLTWWLWLIVTSSLAFSLHLQQAHRQADDDVNTSKGMSGPDSTIKHDRRHLAQENSTFGIDTVTTDSDLSLSHLPASPSSYLELNLGDIHSTGGTKLQSQEAHSSAQFAPKHSRHTEDPFDHDFSSLFASSSPGDLLDDAEIDELISAEGLWTGTGRDVETELETLKAPMDSDGLVGRTGYRRFSRVIVYVAFPLIIVGVVTNVIALKVFRRLSQNVTNTYMTYLIWFDMAYLLFVVSSHIVVVILRAAWTSSSARHFLQLYVIYKFFILSARQVIIMATAFMCLDRYFVIASPFRTHNIFLFRRPRLLILLTAVLILAFNTHKPLKREVREGQFPGTNNTVYYLSYTKLYRNNHGLLDDLTIASSCLFQYCPMIAMLVANIALMASLHKYSRRVSLPDLTMDTFVTSVENGSPKTCRRPACSDLQRSTMTRKDSMPMAKSFRMDNKFFQLEKHKCVAVVAYSLLFFLLALPLALLPILKKVFPEFNVFKSHHYVFLIYVRVFPLLDIISASINFFVFFIKGGAFRAGVCRLLGCRRNPPRNGTFELRSAVTESEGIADSHLKRKYSTVGLSVETKESTKLI